jgi:hypothetical protein
MFPLLKPHDDISVAMDLTACRVMALILGRIDANGLCDGRGCIMGHGDLLFVLFSPPLIL